MEEDDETILLVVGDDISVESSERVQMPHSFVKQQSLSEPEGPKKANEIVRTVTEHGEFLDIEVLQEELDIEMLDNTFDDLLEPNQASKGVEDTTDTETGVKVEEMIINQNEHGVHLDLQNHNQSRKHRKKVSFVKHLETTNPEMIKQPSLIVEHLVSLMKNLKPPELPLGYCDMVCDANNKIKYKCSICNTVSNSSSFAGRHYQEKHGSRYLICYACGADFRSTTNLYKHEKHCISPDAPLVLQARGRYLGRKGRARPFLTKGSFRGTYKGTTRFYCAQCGASFRHRSGVTAHENMHDGLRPHQCHICAATYTSKPGLKRHLLSHDDDKFICDHCGRGFKVKGALVSHLNTHKYKLYKSLPKTQTINNCVKGNVVLNSDIIQLYSQLSDKTNTNKQKTMTEQKHQRN